MRIPGRIKCKLLALVAIIVLIFIGTIFFTNNVKGDEFLTLLSWDESDMNFEIHGQQLPNLTNFAYTLENNLCNNKKEFLAIIIVTSYAGHDELRSAHRQAISQVKLAELGFKRVFLLAEIPKTEHFINQNQLQNEQERFGDLLQGNFMEGYRNLSYKHIMGLRWAAIECKQAKFIIKIDDDIVYDVFQLRRYLELLEVQHAELASSDNLLSGYVLRNTKPQRNIANKWFVSSQEYIGDIYPDYLSGWLYITNSATATKLVYEAQQSNFFWIDDTWVTGILREKLKIPIQTLNAWYSANSEFLDCCVRDLKQYNYECEYFVGPNGGDNKLIVEFLHNVEKCYFDECTKRAPDKSLKQTCVASVKNVIPGHGEAHIKQLTRV
ncbi:beta-1,3-galactosyltransferase 5-like [Teleopsis dalmanni]|uniref:beta-1,3-galactosyltransferase 5-like n=1 Tax=Teleopsis dalmanni TaxID=139649 RepID=UPI0018CD0A2C|nr:beta-1,3-galactosyltransferase 5-like [Teleopsis dalmanni]